MAASTKKRMGTDPGRTPYRFTARQILKMVDAGIIATDKAVELWDGRWKCSPHGRPVWTKWHWSWKSTIAPAVPTAR